MNGEVFRNIYEKNLWEDGGSGGGSALKYAAKFLTYTKEVIKKKKVLDLGSGDFRIGGELCGLAREYVAVDTVMDRFKYPKGVRAVQADFSQPGVVTDVFKKYGPFDVVILKDVLMHWTDDEIRKFVKEFKSLAWTTVLVANKYKYVRKPEYNGRARNPRANRYSMSPLAHGDPTLKPLKLSVVLYYPSSSCVELSRGDK